MDAPSVLRVASRVLSVLVVCLPMGLAVAGSPEAGPAKGTELRRAVREALAATPKNSAPQAADVHKLTGLYRALLADTSLGHTQREGMRLALKTRLQAWQAMLNSRAARDAGAKQSPGISAKEQAAASPPDLRRGVLAQQAPPAAAAQPANPQPPADHSRELVEVIQDTISPETWDTRGGLGVIRYWAPGQALIVRQTGEVHEQLGQLLNDLR